MDLKNETVIKTGRTHEKSRGELGRKDLTDRYRLWLAHIPDLSGKSKIRLERQAGSAEQLYRCSVAESWTFPITDREKNVLKNRVGSTEPYGLYEAMIRQGMHVLYYDDDLCPPEMREVYDSVYCLFYKGSFPERDCFAVGIVGSRVCTAYGEGNALEMGEQFARAKIPVISGMARGVDAMGHRGVLNAGGRTFAILGCGADICYPRENEGLYRDILKSGGGIISEYPPGTRPAPWRFPLRNRIISSLSRAIVVVEAREKSGALITADMALDMGRSVYALPGPIDSDLSGGCNRLIRQGADPVVTIAELVRDIQEEKKKYDMRIVGVCKNDALAETKTDRGEDAGEALSDGHFDEQSDSRSAGTSVGQTSAQQKKDLETTENLVYSCLCLYPKGVHAIIEETGLSASEALQTLVSLEISGLIREIGKHMYVRRQK